MVLSADTVVALAGEIFGKPNDDEDARRMLGALAGREHTVVTAVAVFDGARGPRTVAVETAVVVDGLGAATIDGYIASGEGRDKAGAYAIQGLGGGFVRAIRGSYGNVVGLPASESLELLRGAGVVLEWP
ncbi:MAG: Maf family protein, partial [Myxococcales bacterium]|nr:Maf family protein [Myxococcales bacterium]